MNRIFPLFALVAATAFGAGGLEPGPQPAAAPALLELNERGFFLGREYFVMRSGRAELILQADQADLGPAFTWLLFDAQNPLQSKRKERAVNFVPGEGFSGSALLVQIGEFRFSALGHRTETRWIWEGGVPAVEAVWWAGGVRVTERISAIADIGAFRRSILLEGANLMGPQSVNLRLSLPPVERAQASPILAGERDGARLAIVVQGGVPEQVDQRGGSIEIGPLIVAPHEAFRVDTLLFAQFATEDEGAFLTRVGGLRAATAENYLVLTRQRWAEASSVATTDGTVQELFDKARYGLAGMVADDGAMDAGIFEYGHQWVRDTSNTTVGLLNAGHFELARAALVHLLTTMVGKDGRPMTGGRFEPPAVEELDEMGALLHAVREYRDWTGDDSLVREHRTQLLALIERPLESRFRDPDGLVHGRREYWERTFEDAYELAYQTYLVLGLREAAELSQLLGAQDREMRWRTEADRTLKAMLSHPTKALIHDGHLIKRRDLTGLIPDERPPYRGRTGGDAPNLTETHRRLAPDASMALPIALGIVDPHSDLAKQTLDLLEELWNTRWSDGGYDRYNTSSEPDQPGPWSLATAFMLRAQHDAGLYDRSRRSLEWLNTVQGGRAGAWFEEIPSTRGNEAGCGVLPWTSAEIALFVVHHYLGVGFEHGALVLRPALYPGGPPVDADLRFRKGRLRLKIDGSGPIREARVNGREAGIGADGAVRLPAQFASGEVEIHCGPGRAK